VIWLTGRASDNVTIGEARLSGRKAADAHIPAGERWLGYPAMRGREFRKHDGIAAVGE
jgi:hypothetical protein